MPILVRKYVFNKKTLIKKFNKVYLCRCLWVLNANNIRHNKYFNNIWAQYINVALPFIKV